MFPVNPHVFDGKPTGVPCCRQLFYQISEVNRVVLEGGLEPLRIRASSVHMGGSRDERVCLRLSKSLCDKMSQIKRKRERRNTGQ